MTVICVACIHCKSKERVVKNGTAASGIQRYCCRQCEKSFQIEYRYNANKLDIHKLIVTMTINGSGIRDIGRVLNISPTTVINHLKNSIPLK